MAIKIIEEKCKGCGECVVACPCGVLGLNHETGLAIVKFIDDCSQCNLCIYYCPHKAIEFNY